MDIESGKLVGNGIDKKLNESEKSITNTKFDGFHLVGWDVAISKNGPLIIEGNRGPGFDLVQILLKKGTKYMLDDLLQEVKNGELKEEKEKAVK